MTDRYPSLRMRFLHVFVAIAFATTIIISIALSIADYTRQRYIQVKETQRTAETAAQLYTLVRKQGKLGDYLAALSDDKRLLMLCAYNSENRLLSSWQRGDGSCPAMMTKKGIEIDADRMRIALPVQQSGQYAGMVYAQATLFSWHECLADAAIMLCGMLSVSLSACLLAARFSANSIVASLGTIRRQMECLKSNDLVTCPISGYSMTQETVALSEGINDLRLYFDTTTVSNETLANVREWHWELWSELLSSLRQRLDARSPLIEPLNDYALLLQTIRGDTPPRARSFDIVQIAEQTLERARATCSAHINITTSMPPDMPRQWCGQPEMVEALMRHLLLIGLKRVRSGFVCLKIEPDGKDTLAGYTRIRIALYDSGTFIQHWQLQQWLTLAHTDIPPPRMTGDLSWLLISRLFKRLSGTLSGASEKQGGLALEGSIALAPCAEEPEADHCFLQLHATPPLILLVENDKDHHASIALVMAQAGLRVFIVTDHTQALEWAPILPFSAIILNAALADATDVTRRLRHMAEDGVMPRIPLWVSTTKLCFIDFDYWKRQGIDELLLKPCQHFRLCELCANLPLSDPQFYQENHQRLRDDIMAATLTYRQMDKMLGEQIPQVQPVLADLASNIVPTDGRERPHAVRSAALALGYFRLAALMGQVERAAMLPRNDFPLENWPIVSDAIAVTGF